MSQAHFIIATAILGTCLSLGSVCLAIVLVCAGKEKFAAWREKRAMRVRDAQLQRYSLGAFRGARDRFLS